MKNTAFPILLAALAAASTASAEGVTFLSYGASYTNLSVDDESIDAFGGGASVGYQSGNFIMNGSANVNRLSAEGEDLDITGIDARVGYLATSQFSIYAGLAYADISDFDSNTTYNAGAEYVLNAATFGINYDDSNEDGYVSTTTVYGSYRPADVAEVMLGVSDTDGFRTTTLGVTVDSGQVEIDAFYSDIEGVGLFAMDASYAFGNNFRINGNYADFDGEIDMATIGAGYEVKQDLWIDFNVGRIDAGLSENLDLIGLSISYEMGGENLLVDRATSAQSDALGTLGEAFLTSF